MDIRLMMQLSQYIDRVSSNISLEEAMRAAAGFHTPVGKVISNWQRKTQHNTSW